jgi:hypothetical protein
MSLSAHAQSRMQQRAISPLVLELTLRFGLSQPGGEGTSVVYLDKKGRRNVRSYVGDAFPRISEYLDIYAVVSPEGTVITTGHRTVRIERERKCTARHQMRQKSRRQAPADIAGAIQ